MDNLFLKILERVSDGEPVSVSLAEHTVVAGRETVVAAGVWHGSLGLKPIAASEALASIEREYDIFCRAPDTAGRKLGVSKWFFRDCDTVQDRSRTLWGEDRTLARCRLELTALFYILNGSLTRETMNLGKRWYWQSPRFRSLVILASWL